MNFMKNIIDGPDVFRELREKAENIRRSRKMARRKLYS